ncbi:MAG: winged helix-turn-helix transcriptional regulator, partial [Mesorhizobium sp.]
ADSIAILNRTADGPKLYVRGRDIAEVEKALKFDAGKWSVVGNVEDVKRSDQRRAIMEALRQAAGPMKPADISAATGMSVANINYLLRKMVEAGEAERAGYGLYIAPSESSDPSDSPEINSPSVWED